MQKKLISDRLSCTLVLGMILALSEVCLKPSYSYALKDILTDKTTIESINQPIHIANSSLVRYGIVAPPQAGKQSSIPHLLENRYISSESTSTPADLLLQRAESFFDQGNFQESLKHYQQALTNYRNRGDRLGETVALTGIGAAQIGLWQEAKSLDNLQQALAIQQSQQTIAAPADRKLYLKAEGETRYQLGKAYIGLEQYAKALPLLEQSLAIRKAVGDRYREGQTLATIGVIYVKKFDFQKSLQYFEPALELNRAAGNRAAEAQNLFYLASAYGLLGQKDKSLAMTRQSAIAYQKIDNPLGEANALNLEANIFNISLEYNKSLQLNLKALELVRKAGDIPREAEQLNSVAESYRNLTEFPKAIEIYLQAEKVYQRLGDRAGEGRNLKNIAEVHLAQGQTREALVIFEQAMAIYRDLTNTANAKPSDRNTLASILVGQGSLYTSFSQYPQALNSLQEARSIYRALGDVSGEGVASMFTGSVYLQLGQPEKLLEILKQLPKSLASSPQAQKMEQSLVALFNANPSSKDPQAQLKSTLELLEFFKQSGNRTYEASMLSQVGSIYSDLNQSSQAIASYQQALDIYRSIGDRAGIGSALYSLGLAYSLSDQNNKAFQAFQASIYYAREVGDRNRESKLVGNLGLLTRRQYPELAIAFYKQSINLTESIRKELHVLSLEQQKSYQQTVAANYRVLAALLLKKGRVMEALQVLDLLKVQELQDYLQNVKGNERTAQGIYLFPEESSQVQAITSQPINSVNPLADGNQKIAQQLLKIPPAELNRVPDYLQKLPQGHALLYPLLVSDRLELILFIPNKPPIHRSVAINEADINQLIIDFKSGLRDADSLDVLEPATKLYNLLIKPLEADLTNTSTILYAPDGVLRYVPIAALYDGKQWLVEKYRVNNLIAYSLSDFTQNPPRQMRILAGAFGGAQNTTKFGQVGLPATISEVQSISDALPDTTKLVANDFSRKATEAQMQNKNIVHLATHAEFNSGNPENSFLIFGNGDRILLNEMKDLPMSNVDLIVLSACQTGVGKLGNGIEILGFGYQAQRAGAKAAIASLWKVSDEGTQALMQAFYNDIKIGDRSKAESLRQAQIATMRSKNFSHPYYWSAFILISNGL
jgi:CHAT domain-containing protein